ncbi:MAG: HAD family hydrolase [Candidatus Electrothrix sp. MAN1_4]|nr:HAD family hydrolase [Candidatus Electrothrix sp. MAN1_4]
MDGIVTDGLASVDQHALTGEARPAEKVPGDPVLAATIVITGRIFIKVERSGQETTVAKINQVLNSSLDFKTNVQLKGEQWADMWILPIIGLAGLSLPVLGPVGFVMILNSHFSNKVRVAASLSTLNYLTVASHNGILIKDGRALEILNGVDIVLFDKTGTLTYNNDEVAQIIPTDTYQETEILAYAAAAERHVAHPIAYAILKKAEELHCTFADLGDKSEYQLGYGITVNLAAEDKTVRAGSPRFMLNEGIPVTGEIKAAEMQAHSNGHSFVLIALNDKVIGAIELKTSVRPEARKVIQQLRHIGIKDIAIVSGDHKLPTQKMAESLGINKYYCNTTPVGKADIVKQLRSSGKSVCFFGDGINDAIAMQQADVSISIHGATSIATDVAEVILMDGTLTCLADIFQLSRKLERHLQNIFRINIVPSVIKIGGLLLLNFGMLTGILIDVVFFFTAIGVSMLPLSKIRQEGEKLPVKEYNVSNSISKD